MDTLFILGAKYLFVLSLVIGGYYFFKQPREVKKRMLLVGTISIILIYLTSIIVGHLYYNPRPFVIGNFTPIIPHDPDNGFPSDHVLLVSAIAAIITCYNRRYGVILWFIALLVAISRVFVGVHHPIDVLGSALISIVITAVTYNIFNAYPKEIIQGERNTPNL